MITIIIIMMITNRMRDNNYSIITNMYDYRNGNPNQEKRRKKRKEAEAKQQKS